jgi:hypothetical protein
MMKGIMEPSIFANNGKGSANIGTCSQINCSSTIDGISTRETIEGAKARNTIDDIAMRGTTQGQLGS